MDRPNTVQRNLSSSTPQNLSTEDMDQYLIWDIDSQEDLEDQVTTTLFEAVDREKSKERKKDSKTKKDGKKKKKTSKKGKKRGRSSSSNSSSKSSDSSSDDSSSKSSSEAWF